jgi:DNA gyrase inhibitor GyrI
MKHIFLSFLALIFMSGCAVTAEEISHNVIKKDGNIEIRQYDETVIAKVTVEATRREATSKAFRSLFKFISGDNVAKQEISMTAPVSQQPVSQKIPMTTPVAQESAGEGQWQIAFYMPNDMEFDITPKPTNDNVTIERIPAQKMAAIRFSGRSTDDNIAKHEQELLQYMTDNNIDYIPEPTYAFYNPPWTPWFMRRNEVLFKIVE